MGYSNNVLFNNGPLIQIHGYVVAGRTNEFDTPAVCLMVRPCAGKRGEEAVVDINDLARIRIAQ